MATFKLLVDGEAVDEAFYQRLSMLEIEEHADLPGALRLTLPLSADGAGGLQQLHPSNFLPYTNLAVVIENGESKACIFDGFVLSHRTHLDRGTTDSTLQVWAQDASCLMNQEEKAREWVDVTDSQVAGAIFGEYGFSPASENGEDDSPSHTERGHSLMQRATDIQFLRMLARRNGKLCRVTCEDTPGQYSGYFAAPDLEAEPALSLTLNDPSVANVAALDFEWDVARPSAVRARQALFNDASPSGASGDADDSGLPLLDEQGLADFVSNPNTAMLTVPVDDAGELAMRARAMLREAGWFARCQGGADASSLSAIMRAGNIVAVNGASELNSGKYLVWSVRHSIAAESHTIAFELVRNAVGPAPKAGGGLLGGLL